MRICRYGWDEIKEHSVIFYFLGYTENNSLTMKNIFVFIFIVCVLSCNSGAKDSANKHADSTVLQSSNSQEMISDIQHDTDIDSAYTIIKNRDQFLITGLFNPDNIIDTAQILTEKKTGRHVIFIQHGGSAETFLMKNGADIGADFSDFNWVAEFRIISRGTIIFNNVVDGEIVDDDQVPADKKITLKTDGILMHADEGGGGGIIYFDNGKYHWVQQD
jgi:hypothetical protein